ncbi:flagellar basal-body rod protein FlgF [Agrobacterium vitis]|uniref:Flagellar basal-body rod protein FlgF n=1 Tax=Agrobacterium vitis TaxID=373 RepID=A0ABD6GI62_AGRVI|nr:flagellar basal-body rod protein FlgF [Agrobacterium vitis]MUO81919.1 flagellar basal-body rod protein FlgF [Agrobacterium vitis]MUO94335.1 flagellar basal-body rod protein FlgF [Agrobacterium vitis]MUP07913.1 flagellar basal-body rod protein FlgF [Agrobacterium vitis]MUZ85451.1 flagellar basal-body rod protein FlgF [Agrobacterium vitis]MVA12612.1 flagellar basal-body rod protein FlgF [Agrobacterium vitis]
MQSGMYVSLSSQRALDKRLTTIADNMANVNTVGFRGTEVKFDEVVSRTGNDQNAKIAFVSQGNDYLNTQSGEMLQTGGSLDFAVKGDAWFSIDTPAGPALTRDGRFTMTSTGQLVSVRGYPVLDAGGGPIQLDPNGGEPHVGSDGTINQNGRQISQIGLFTADISKGYLRTENSGVITTDRPQAVVDDATIGVMQGYVEQSNVNGISQMTQLIQVSRAFESISASMSQTENSMSETIKTLGGSK